MALNPHHTQAGQEAFNPFYRTGERNRTGEVEMWLEPHPAFVERARSGHRALTPGLSSSLWGGGGGAALPASRSAPLSPACFPPSSSKPGDAQLRAAAFCHLSHIFPRAGSPVAPSSCPRLARRRLRITHPEPWSSCCSLGGRGGTGRAQGLWGCSFPKAARTSFRGEEVGSWKEVLGCKVHTLS